MKVKIHKGTRYVVAICDSNLFGKKFSEGEKQLDLTGGFFDGDEKSEEEIEEIIKDMKLEDACFNIVGNESVNLAKAMGIVKDEGVIEIGGVLVALVLM